MIHYNFHVYQRKREGEREQRERKEKRSRRKPFLVRKGKLERIEGPFFILHHFHHHHEETPEVLSAH